MVERISSSAGVTGDGAMVGEVGVDGVWSGWRRGAKKRTNWQSKRNNPAGVLQIVLYFLSTYEGPVCVAFPRCGVLVTWKAMSLKLPRLSDGPDLDPPLTNNRKQDTQAWHQTRVRPRDISVFSSIDRMRVAARFCLTTAPKRLFVSSKP